MKNRDLFLKGQQGAVRVAQKDTMASCLLGAEEGRVQESSSTPPSDKFHRGRGVIVLMKRKDIGV